MSTIKEQQHQTDTSLFGFWVYLMTDCVLFASLFATYAVLRSNTYDGPLPAAIISLPTALIETLLLLTSSFTSGMGLLALRKKLKRAASAWYTATFLLGAAFLTFELREFSQLVNEGSSWRTSGFLSAFFTLLGTHGLHIAVGLLWLIVLLVFMWKKKITGSLIKKFQYFGLFWHFLDIIWIFIFTIVYLMGVIHL